MIVRPGFTLVEAVVALTVLFMAAGACLELRAGALARSRAIEQRQAEARRAITLIELAQAGQLDGAAPLDEEDPAAGTVWAGEIAGTPYRLTRTLETVANPMHAVDASRYPERVEVARYRLEMSGETRVVEAPA